MTTCRIGRKCVRIDIGSYTNERVAGRRSFLDSCRTSAEVGWDLAGWDHKAKAHVGTHCVQFIAICIYATVLASKLAHHHPRHRYYQPRIMQQRLHHHARRFTLEALTPPSPSLRSGQISGAQVSQPQLTIQFNRLLLRTGVQDARRRQSELF